MCYWINCIAVNYSTSWVSGFRKDKWLHCIPLFEMFPVFPTLVHCQALQKFEWCLNLPFCNKQIWYLGKHFMIKCYKLASLISHYLRCYCTQVGLPLHLLRTKPNLKLINDPKVKLTAGEKIQFPNKNWNKNCRYNFGLLWRKSLWI